MDYNTYNLAGREKVLFVGGVIILLSLIGWIFYKSIFTVITVPFLMGKCRSYYCSFRISCRKDVLLAEFKDFLYLISSSLTTGRHMEKAMAEAREGLEEIYAQSYMRDELEHMIISIEETGETADAVLADFASRAELEDVDDFVQVYRCCKETGGNLVKAIDKAATVIGDKINGEREIRVIASQKKLEGRIITAMPVLIIAFLQLTSPDYIDIMYETIAGRLIMTIALLIEVFAYILVERTLKIEI